MSTSSAAPVLRFRNYRPQEATASATSAELVKPVDAPSVQLARQLASLEGPLAALPPSSSADAAAGSSAGTVPAAVSDPDSITIAPRKPNWDLKRDVAAKLDILNKQTERALAEMVRQKIAASGSVSSAVSVAAPAGERVRPGGSSAESGLAGSATSGGASSSGRDEVLTDDALRAMETAESSARWGGAEDIDI